MKNGQLAFNMIRLHQLFARRSISFIIIRSKQSSATSRTYSKGSGEDCGKKSVSCLGAATDPSVQPSCPKPPEDTCQQGTLKVLPLPADCKSNKSQPGPVYDPTCSKPYINPCKDSVKTCKSDMVPYPCVTPCERKKQSICLGEPDCAYERRIDWGLRARQIILALGAILGGLVLYRMYGSEVKVQIDGSVLKKDRRFVRPMEVVKIPESSSDIPDKVDYLLIGGGTAAYAAQQAIKSSAKDSKVLIISDAPPYLPSFRPPLSKDLWSEKDRDRALDLEFRSKDKTLQSVIFEPAKNYTPVKQLNESPGVGVAQGYHVKKLMPQKKTAVLEDGKKISYDKCLLATGGKPRIPPPFDEAETEVLKKVTFYRNTFDFQELEEMIQEGELTCLAIVGGGLLGTELAVALKERTKDLSITIVNVVKDVGNLTKILPTYLAKRVTTILKDRGIQVMTNTVVEEVAKEGSSIKLYVTNDHCITADHTIVASGIDPNTDLAEGSCLELDPVNGGFLVNSEMQLAQGLYAAGDCASFYDCDLGRRREEHHYNATATGKIAGENMTGKSNQIVSQPTFGVSIAPDYQFEAVGKVDATKCCTVGVFPKEAEKVAEQGNDEEDGMDQLGSKKREMKVALISNAGESTDEANAGKNGSGSGEGYDIVKDDEDTANTLAGQAFDRGVVYYLNEQQVIIGVLLINLPGKISLAQALIKEKKTYDDINEVTKKFDLRNPPEVKNIGNNRRKRKRESGRKDMHHL